LIAYAGHKGDMSELSDNEMNEMSSAIRSAVDILKKTLSPQGFNIGYNLGICAGAGLPDHLHAHIVPRWTGDTNFMAVVGDSRVIPDALDTLYGELGAAAEASGLR
jgi:ATP adenylyltransferase